MTILSPAETVMRPAAALLGEWLSPGSGTGTNGRSDALAMERAALTGDIARAVSQMDDETIDCDALDALTAHIAGLLARMEELRLAQMLTSRAASDTWLASVDLT